MFRFKTKSYKIKGKKLTIPNNKSQLSKFTFIQREFFKISETFTIQYISCKLSQEQCSLPNNFLLRSRVFETTLHRILYLPKQPSTLKATKKLKHTTDNNIILRSHTKNDAHFDHKRKHFSFAQHPPKTETKPFLSALRYLRPYEDAKIQTTLSFYKEREKTSK